MSGFHIPIRVLQNFVFITILRTAVGTHSLVCNAYMPHTVSKLIWWPPVHWSVDFLVDRKVQNKR
jgi:hypothetical protein